jgi:hypothetical protein
MYSESSLKLIVMAIFLIASFSCSKQPASELKIINVLESEEGELSISEIADDITYLPLANDSLLAYIMKVVYSDGEYFVKDNKSTFLRFDENGDFVNKIGNRGNGPGEYRFVSDFVIHPDTRDIFITGGKQDQIMVYSPEGSFIRSFDLTKQSVSSIGINGDNIFAFYFYSPEHDTVNMQLLDFNGAVLNDFQNKYEFERGRAMIMFTGECLMYEFENRLHFKEIFSDTVFYMDGQKLLPEIILNSGNIRFTPEVRSKIISELSADPRATSESMVKTLTQNNLFETGNYLFYIYGYDKKVRTLIYNKSTGSQVEIDEQAGIINDWDGGPNIHLKMRKDDSTVFSWIDAYELKTYVATEAFKNSTPKYPEKKKELEQLANSLNENDNPVLMLVKLKE